MVTSKTARLAAGSDAIDVESVERERTPREAMDLGFQPHLTGLPSSDTVSILEIFGVQRSRKAVHDWVHTSDLRPTEGRSPDQGAIDRFPNVEDATVAELVRDDGTNSVTLPQRYRDLGIAGRDATIVAAMERNDRSEPWTRDSGSKRPGERLDWLPVVDPAEA